MEPTGFDHHGPDHSGPSSRVALPSTRMSTEEVLKALERYTEEARESDRQTATKLGINRMTLTEYSARNTNEFSSPLRMMNTDAECKTNTSAGHQLCCCRA